MGPAADLTFDLRQAPAGGLEARPTRSQTRGREAGR
jgi:hypothetical protein